MKTFLSTLAVALAFTFTAVPADAAQTQLQKCRSFVAKVEMDYAKCLKKGVVLQEKGKSSDVSKCDRKRDIGILKAEALYVAKQGVDSDACGLDETSLSISKALMLVAAGEDPADYGISAEVLAGTVLDATSDNAAVYATAFARGAASVDITTDNQAVCTDAGGTYAAGTDTCSVDITSDNEAVCTGAGGTWDGSACTPAAVADRDCFREGACGVDGWNSGSYVGVTASSSGCAAVTNAAASYQAGTSVIERFYFSAYYFSEYPSWGEFVLTTLCVTN